MYVAEKKPSFFFFFFFELQRGISKPDQTLFLLFYKASQTINNSWRNSK